jgi:hypothetical protein
MVVVAPGVGAFVVALTSDALPAFVPVRSWACGPCMRLGEPLFRCQLRQLSRRLEWCTVSEASEAALAAPGTCSMQHPAFELLRIPLPRTRVNKGMKKKGRDSRHPSRSSESAPANQRRLGRGYPLPVSHKLYDVWRIGQVTPVRAIGVHNPDVIVLREGYLASVG